MAEVGPTPDTEDLKQEEPASKPADKPQETPKEKPKELPKDQPNKHLTRATALEETLKEHLAKVDNAQTLSAADAKRINKAVKAKIKDIQAKLSKSETPEAKLEACIEQLTEQIRALKVAEREIELRRDAQDANTTYTNQLVSDASRIAKVNLNLESLCRELQTQNKSIVELNAQVIADEKEKREKQQAKVDEVVQTINVKLGEQEQESIKVATENAQLREQVSRLKAQCEAMETYIKAALTEKELEVKIHKTKCEQMEAMLEESKTKLVQFLDLLQSREQELSLFNDCRLELQMEGMYEMAVEFPPTYPFAVTASGAGAYADTRAPGWCDRILMTRATKERVKMERDNGTHQWLGVEARELGLMGPPAGFRLHTKCGNFYGCLMPQQYVSDHLPVVMLVSLE
eukprot:c18969_g1_i4.p1 GENE.c18969_g1_i4~~c18969_g1_i4.p1  ORF type:complete len:413 (+),score=118.95 c18969_g1_i4:33-1241(+)